MELSDNWQKLPFWLLRLAGDCGGTAFRADPEF